MHFARLPIAVQLFIIGIVAALFFVLGNNLISQPHPAFTVSASWNGGFGTSLTSFGLLLVVVVCCVVITRVRVRITIMRVLSSVVTSLTKLSVRVFEPLVNPLFSITPEATEGPEFDSESEEPQAEAAPEPDAIDSMERGLVA